jgi:hypothetical protein
VITVSSDHFTRTGNEFVAEVSDFGSTNLFSRIYPDACDVGFAMQSTRTGKEAVFYLAEEKRDGEGGHAGLDLQTHC